MSVEQKIIEALVEDNKALKAQVELLRNALNYSGVMKDCQQLRDVFDKTKQQCLAIVKADAIDEALTETCDVFLVDVWHAIAKYSQQLRDNAK